MDEFVKAAANVGFPMVLSAYLLLRLESRLEAITTAIRQLSTSVGLLHREAEVQSDGRAQLPT